MDSRLLAAISSQSNTSSIGAVATTTTAVNGTNGGSTITGANTNVTASLVSPVKQPPAVPPHNTATKVISYIFSYDISVILFLKIILIILVTYLN